MFFFSPLIYFFNRYMNSNKLKAYLSIDQYDKSYPKSFYQRSELSVILNVIDGKSTEKTE